MYRRSNKTSQLTLFTSAQSLLRGKSLKVYEDNQKWHNQFRTQVTYQIDEDLFRPLFSKDFGAPNASIRVLIGMMVLKEAQGWSDSQLFEQCHFNLLVRNALGLMNIDDTMPAESTYYLLRKRIVEWETGGNENLLSKVFSQVTKSQSIEFNINGNKIRMDSKLLGSNIAWYSRYELIHESLCKAYRQLKVHIDRFLTESEICILERISVEGGDKVVYRSSKTELELKLSELGSVIYKIINQIKDDTSASLQTLRRVFSEQYQIIENRVEARPKQEISASSVQSPHDTDCHYRNKDDNQVKGYSINITETCDTTGSCETAETAETTDSTVTAVPSLNLITHVSVEVASVADCDFLQPAVEATREIVTGNIESINADGAYHSPDNQVYCRKNSIDLIVSAIQGKPPRYDLAPDENGELTVTDTNTNTTVPVRKISSRKDASTKWVIRGKNNKYRYFTQKEIDTCLLRKTVSGRPQTELNRRNNVEATIFQLGFHYPNDKSRYRGIIKHKMWVNVRCLWINFVRILNYIAGGVSKCVQKAKNRLILPQFVLNFGEICKIYINTTDMSPVKIFMPKFAANPFF